MGKSEISANVFFRVSICLLAIILPILLLSKGIYGSFIFTFSIPVIWQIGFLGKSGETLGLKINSIKPSIIAGVITGCLLGFIGGFFLRLIGITGYVFNNVNKLQFSIGSFSFDFPLQKELGYRLLNISSTPIGLCVYLLFSIFLIGFGEEIFWRGFIQKKVSSYLPVNLSIWLTAILFASIHFYIFTILPIKIGIYFLFLIAISGLAWGYLFKYFNSVWSSAISHGISAFIIWKYYFFTR